MHSANVYGHFLDMNSNTLSLLRGICKVAVPLVRVVLLVYLGFGATLFFFQRDFLYHPSGLPFGECAPLANARAVTLEGGARGYFKHVSNEQVVVMYHGNAGSACHRAFFAHFFEAAGYSFFLAEYAGYAGDPRGAPYKEALLGDARLVAHFIAAQGFDRVVVAGESLGASVAAYHATHAPVSTLVFFNPTYSIAARAAEMYPMYPVNFLLQEQFDTFAWAARAEESSIALIHAADDAVVPSHHSKRLYEALPHEQKTFTLIPHTTHNTMFSSSLFWDALNAALAPF